MTFQADQFGAANKGGAISETPMNVGNIEHTVSILRWGCGSAAAVAAAVCVYVTLALLSAYAMSRGVTGRCALYAANINTHGARRVWPGRSATCRTAGHRWSIALRKPRPLKLKSGWNGATPHQVEQSSWEWFPASNRPGGSIT